MTFFRLFGGPAMLMVAVVLLASIARSDDHCPEVISTQEACSLVNDVDGAGLMVISANAGYDSWRLNLPRLAERYAPHGVDSLEITTFDGRDRVIFSVSSVWITPRDGNGRCHIDPGQAHCTTPATWHDSDDDFDWDRFPSNFFVKWYRSDGGQPGGDPLLTREYFICDNHDCGEPAQADREVPARHRDETEAETTQTTQSTETRQTTQPQQTTVTPTVKVSETDSKLTVEYTEIANPVYEQLAERLRLLNIELAALETEIAATPKTVRVEVEPEPETEPVSMFRYTIHDITPEGHLSNARRAAAGFPEDFCLDSDVVAYYGADTAELVGQQCED